MRWLLANKGENLHHWILEDGLPLIEIKYNPVSHFFRLFGSEKRVFFLEWAGLFHSKISLKTEYNMLEGVHYVQGSGNEILLEGYDHAFYYKMVKDRLVVNLDGDKVSEVEVEGLSFLDHFECSALLFSLGKYLKNIHTGTEQYSMAQTG